MKQKLLTKGKGILLVLLCLMSAFSIQAVNVIPYLSPLQSFGGASVDATTISPVTGDFTLEVQGTSGTLITVSGGYFSYTPTNTGTVRFAQRNGKVYVFEGSNYMSTITPDITKIVYTDITSNITSASNLLQNPGFETFPNNVWKCYDYNASNIAITAASSSGTSIRATTALTGSYALLFHQTARYLTQSIPAGTIKSNRYYKLAFKYKTNSAGSSQFGATFRSDLGTTERGSDLTMTSSTTTLDNVTVYNYVTTFKVETINASNPVWFCLERTANYNVSPQKLENYDNFTLVEGTLSAGITGASSSTVTYLAGTAYSPEGIIVNYAGGDYYDMTPQIVNPSFEDLPLNQVSTIPGWTNTGTWVTQNNTSPTWTKDGTYYIEKWIASGSNLTASSLTQTISNLPNGKYKLTMSGHAVQQSTGAVTTGASAFANLASTAVTAAGNYTVDNALVADGTMQLGFKLVAPITCNWAAYDNFKLFYYGPVPILSAPQTSVSLTTATNTATINLTGQNITEDVTFSAPAHITLSGGNVVDNLDGTYKILVANANALNAITVTWDKAANVSTTLNFLSGTATKSVTLTTSDITIATLSNITVSSGNLTPTFSSGTYSYSLKVPANVSSSTVTGVPSDAAETVSNNGTTLSIGTPSVSMGTTSYDGLTTNNYTVGFSNYVLDDWDANGSVDATMSVPTVYGWYATPILTWGAANTGVGGTVRYMDITAGAGVSGNTYTNNSTNYTGRILFERWDGSPTRIYSYPVYLIGCKSYIITGKAAWNSVATAPVLTFRVNSANDNSGTTYGTTTDTTSTAGKLIDFSISNFSVPTSGVYYITTTSSTASLCAVSDFAIAENTTESMGVSPLNLLFYANNLSKTITISGNLLANDIAMSAPVGITLSAPGVTSGKDITILKADAQCGVVVTATWDAANQIVNQPIHVTSGAFSQDINVYADKNDCMTPLYGDHTNLIAEPYMNNLTGFTNSWGALSIATGSEAYCGYGSAKLVGVNGASITTPNISWLPNTKYRVRAMVKTTGDFQFGFQNTYAGGTVATYEIVIPSTNGVWTPVDYVFTTGASAVAGFTYFNMQGRGGTLGYIDNWELYNISDLSSEPDFGVKAWEQKVDQNITTSTFEVAPSARLTVNAAKTLTATTLNLKSDLNGTATLLNNGTLAITTANVQQYMTTGRNWYFSSPVTGATKSAVNATDVYRYNEPTATWPTLAAEDVLAVGQGYVANPSGNGVATFTGTIFDGTKDLSFTRTNAIAHSGFFLAGNPYPSYLNWSAATKTTMNPTVWYRSKHATTGNYVFETYNSLLSIGSDVSGRVPVTSYIPPMQAFWVRISNESNTGAIEFTNAMRSHMDITQNKFRSEAVQQVLRLRVSNGVNEDEAIVAFNSNASNDLDNFDSQKMSNNNLTIPEIFTVAGSEQLAINGMNAVSPNLEMPLGFFTKSANKFSIRASQISNFDADTRIILKDKLLNQEFDLTDASSYNFTSEVANTTDRFSILFKSASGATGLKNDVLADMKAFRNENNKIQINYLGSISKDASYKIYSINGQLISNGAITSANTVVAKSLNSGIYLVKLMNEGNVLTTKVLVF